MHAMAQHETPRLTPKQNSKTQDYNARCVVTDRYSTVVLFKCSVIVQTVTKYLKANHITYRVKSRMGLNTQ